MWVLRPQNYISLVPGPAGNSGHGQWLALPSQLWVRGARGDRSVPTPPGVAPFSVLILPRLHLIASSSVTLPLHFNTLNIFKSVLKYAESTKPNKKGTGEKVWEGRVNRLLSGGSVGWSVVP